MQRSPFADILGDFIANDRQKLRPLSYVFLILLCLAFFVPGIASLPPTDRDESLFAQSTKQMIESGDYTDIHFQQKERYKKPVGIYWLQALSVKWLNPDHMEEIWAYRLPSLVGATIAVLMTAILGALLFGPMAGLLAAIMMVGCAILNFEARLAKTDAVLLATVLLAQYALAKAYLGKSSSWGNALLFWTAAGLGILIKGPIIALVVLSTLLWLRVTDKNLKWFSALKPLAGIPYMLLLTVPWFAIIIMKSHGDFLQQAAGHDMLAKIFSGQDRGLMPPGLHLLFFIGVFFPFSLIAMLAVPDAWHNRRDKAVSFALGWIIPTWIVFELSLTKLPHYVLPTYPAIAMLAAKFMCDGFPILLEKGRRWYIALITTAWILTGLVVALLPIFFSHYVDKDWSPYAVAAGAALLIAQTAALFMLPKNKVASVAVLALGGLILSAVTFGSTLPNLRNLWISRDIVQTAGNIRPCLDFKITSAGYEEPSLVFMAGTDTKIVLPGHYVAAEMLHDPCRIGVVDSDHLAPFLTAFSDAPAQPVPVTTIKEFNLARGKWMELTFYTLPSRATMTNETPR
jgi:4-amino-4-deoxy-L-arabinose transferase-like glycosyltransferase